MQNNGLKKETSVFEWFVSKSLTNITNVIQKIGTGSGLSIVQTGGQVFIENSYIYSGHYTAYEFSEIFKRRSLRFQETIKNNNNILFIRLETEINKTYSVNEINEFIDSVKTINPNVDNMKLMLIIPYNMNIKYKFIKPYHKSQIHHPFLIIKYIDINLLNTDIDLYCKGSLLNNIFLSFLKDAGYDYSSHITREITE
jgi:hypothetical protein